MTTTWAGLPVSMRKDRRCATEGCDLEPVWTMTAGDVASDYCGLCKLEIVRDAHRRATDRITAKTLAALPPFPNGD